MDKICGIYIIKNIINNKIYIGSAKNITKRWYRHRSDLNGNNHGNILLQRAWVKYGLESFLFEVLEHCSTEHLLEREQFYLDLLKPFPDNNGYNIGKTASGGDNLTNHPNRLEIIEKISKTFKEKYEKFTDEDRKELSLKMMGENNPNYGNKWSDELKLKVSEIVKERYKDNPHTAKGKTYDEIYGVDKANNIKENLSKARKNKNLGEDNHFFGKHHTEETKEKLRNLRLGKYNGNQNKPILIDGILYNSVGEASKKLNIKDTTIRWRVISKNPNFINYKYAD